MANTNCLNQLNGNGNGNDVVLYEDHYYFRCPHCYVYISVQKKDLNCKIFRCGVFKFNNQPIPPHAPRKQCDEYKSKDLINGCGKPFIFKDTYVEKCDYI